MALTKVGCPHCGATMELNAVACPKCGRSPHEPVVIANGTDEFSLMRNMSESQRVLFQTQLNGRRKDPTTGVLLAVFLGGLGVHHFYMGNIFVGVLYLLFCWTFIPAIVALLEAFTMPSRVRAYNDRVAGELARNIKALSAS